MAVITNKYTITGGTSMTDARINNGGQVFVNEFGMIDSSTVNSGGYLEVQDGGSATDIKVNSAGRIQINDTAEVAKIYVSSGATLNKFYILASQTVNNNQINISSAAVNENGAWLNNGHAVTNVAVNKGGILHVNNGAKATSATVNGGATVHVNGGATITSAIVNNGAKIYVNGGATASDIDVKFSGSMDIYGNGKVSNVTIRQGGIVNGFTVLKEQTWGSQVVIESARFGHGAVLYAGQVANNVTYVGGSFCNATICGTVNNLMTAATDSLYNNLIVYNGTVNSGTIGGNLSAFIAHNATLNNLKFDGNANNYLKNGRANNITIQNGGIITDGVMSGTTINNGGTVNNFGTTSDTVVNFGGKLVIKNGSMRVSSYMDVWNDIINSYTYSATMSGSGIHRGTLMIADGGSVTIENGARLDLTVSERSTADDYLINDYSRITNNGKLTITVSAVQEEGIYNLVAAGADKMPETISIYCNDFEFGQISIKGEKLTFEGSEYTLNKSETGALTLTVTNAPVDPINGVVGIYKNKVLVSSASVVTGVSLGNGGNDTMRVWSGAVASNTTVNAGGIMIVSSGGTHTGSLHINEGGKVTVESGSILNFDLVGRVETDGYLVTNFAEISGSGATYTITLADTMEKGEYKLASGVDSFNDSISIYNNEGYNGVLTANSGIAFEYGEQTLFLNLSGGNLTLTVKDPPPSTVWLYNDSKLVYSTYKPVNGIVLQQGNTQDYMEVQSGGVASNTTVMDGAQLHLSSGAIHRGTLQLEAGAIVYADEGSLIEWNLTTVTPDNDYFVNDMSLIAGEAAYTITITDTMEFGVYKLAQNADSFTGSISVTMNDESFGTLTVNGETMRDLTRTYALTMVDGNLKLEIGKAPEMPVIVYSSGKVAYYGETMSGMEIKSGANNSMFVKKGGAVEDTSVTSRGYLYITSGGTATGTVLAGGRQYVSSGAAANETSVQSGGYLYVSEGGAVAATTVNSNGNVYLYEGATAVDTVIDSRGAVRVSGGTAENTTILRYGELVVGEDSVAADTTVQSGGKMVISSGAVHKGFMALENGANVSAYFGGIIEFSVDSMATDGDYLISNLGLITGAPEFTLSVADEQTDGKYKLAQNAGSLVDSTINVYVGETLVGELTVDGETAYLDGKGLTLDCTEDGDMTLIVSNTYATVFGNFGTGSMFELTTAGNGVIHSASGTIELAGTVDFQKTWMVIGSGDFDKDGVDGLLWLNKTTNNIFIQNDMTSFADLEDEANCFGGITEDFKFAAAGDFTGNGTGVLLQQITPYGDPEISKNYGLAVWTWDENGDKANGWVGALVNTWEEGDALKGDTTDLADINAKNYQYDVAGVGDFNGDGADDVLIRNIMPEMVDGVEITGSGDIFAFITGDKDAVMNAVDPTVTYSGRATGGWDIAGVGDFDGDGIDDVLLSNGTEIAAWKMADGIRVSDMWLGAMEAGQSIAGVADVDNDGTDDIIFSTGAYTNEYVAWQMKDGAKNSTIAIA